MFGLRGAAGEAAVRFAVEAAHTRRERRRRVDRVRRRPHKQRCVPVAAAGRNGTARVATGSVCRVASLCARHVCTAVGLPLCRHPLHQRARQGLPRGSAQLGVASTLLLHRTSAITSQCRESKTTTSGTHGCLGSKAGDESRTECLATQLRRSPGVWQAAPLQFAQRAGAARRARLAALQLAQTQHHLAQV